MTTGLSIILTCYNEVPVIFESYLTLSALMKVAGINHEFIVVDDGSDAQVQKQLEEFFRGHPARVILSERNAGRGAAVMKGIRAATQDYVGFIDTDLEIPAHSLPVLLYATVDHDADMAIAGRVYPMTLRLRDMIRTLGSIFLKWVTSVMLDVGRLDTETGAKVFRRRAILHVLETVSSERWFWDTEIIAEAIKRSQRVIEVPIVVMRRTDKGSTVRPVRDGLRHLRSILAYRRGRISMMHQEKPL